jgi:hypothetical protein
MNWVRRYGFVLTALHQLKLREVAVKFIIIKAKNAWTSLKAIRTSTW